MLHIHTQAPDFELYDQNHTIHKLSDFLGKTIVLYFYPKDHTPGCTKEALGFKMFFEEFKKRDVVIIGISKDSSASHFKFAQAFELPFLLLSDPSLTTIQNYDVWHEKKLYGKSYMGVVRTTYIIDSNGQIIYANDKVSVTKHAEELLNLLKK
ncbi:MAG: peroxiredoxin [Prevotella sp.]|nr:peroxiredoxin [Staphylococcus sp.]MCM1349991.1 peroxiredoxin [Prevotella sp.]